MFTPTPLKKERLTVCTRVNFMPHEHLKPCLEEIIHIEINFTILSYELTYFVTLKTGSKMWYTENETLICLYISVISWRSVLLVEETGVSVENHRPVASHRQNLSHNVAMNGVRTHNVSGNRQ